MHIEDYLGKIRHLGPHSHKGNNGKVMVIGGSELFHAASRWSLDVVARMVDMVFYSSVPVNNELIMQAKGQFWDGMVVPRGEIENYVDEADVVLIGPGMTRDARHRETLNSKNPHFAEASRGKQIPKPTAAEWENDTYAVTNYLLSAYPNKKWVIDAGALQMVEPSLLSEHCIITPHEGELVRLEQAIHQREGGVPALLETGATVLLKGQKDHVMQDGKREEVAGGNPGMTKGGTGDALAGLVAGLYAYTDDPFAAAVVGSFVNKRAGDDLYKTVGPFFTTTDLVHEIPKVLKDILEY